MMDADLQTLLTAWLSGEWDEAALAPLLQRLKSDEKFRRSFTEELALFGQLKAVQSSEPRWLKLEDLLDTALDHEASDDIFEARVMDGLGDPVHRNRPQRMNRRLRSLVAVFSTAAIFTAFIFWFGGRPDMRNADPNQVAQTREVQPRSGSENRDAALELASNVEANAIAVLSQSVNAQWDGDRQPVTGDSLEPGDLMLKRGTIQIEFLAGVRLLLQAPANIELRAADEVLLRQGKASCFVTEMGRGFRIVTKEMEVIDLGTSFSIQVGRGGPPEVHVLEGSVEIKSRQGGALELRERQAIRMGDDGPQDVAYSPERFPQTSDLRDQQRLRARQRYKLWRKNADVLSSDPSVMLHYTFEETDPSALELTNEAADPSRATDGVVIGCQWDEGRWPSKRALVYRNASDRVLFQVPGSVDAVTFLVWARIDAMTQRTTSLLMTETPERRRRFAPTDQQTITDALRRRAESNVKTVRWELAQHSNKVMFSVGHGAALSEYDAFDVDHEFTRSESWGNWACLGVTCDVANREVIHYLNGEPIGVGRFEHADPLLLDFMELGNFGVSGEELEESGGFAQRRFYGAFDEVVIANRVFDPAEIKSFWTNGKP